MSQSGETQGSGFDAGVVVNEPAPEPDREDEQVTDNQDEE